MSVDVQDHLGNMLFDALTDYIRFSSAQKNRIPLMFPGDVCSWFSSPSMSSGVFHLAVFRRSRKEHKENRQKWMHIDVWTRFSSHSCQKLSLECESAPTSSCCSTVNKETEVSGGTVHAEPGYISGAVPASHDALTEVSWFTIDANSVICIITIYYY